jgi:hypothetical protein
VASKQVGLEIYALRRIISKTFDVYFHLWRDGGADWIRERRKWEQEQLLEWKPVTHSKKPHQRPKNGKRVSFCKNLVQDSP